MNTAHTTNRNETVSKLSGSFWWLNATQFLGALNDNVFKLLIVFFLIHVHGAAEAGAISAKAGIVFVVPFLLFSAASGVLADRISKQRIVIAVKVIEVIVMLLGTIAFFKGSESGLYAILFMMAMQSALFSPSKYGIIPELVRKDQLSRANSFLESFTYLAIILGTAIAPFLSQTLSSNYGRAAVFCTGIAIAGFFASLKIETTPPAGSVRRATVFFARDIWNTLMEVRQDRYLFLAVLGSAYFMFVGAFAQINLIPYGMQSLQMTQEQSGYLFIVSAVGIGIGSFGAGKLSGRNVEVGVVPIGAIGLALSMIALSSMYAEILIIGMNILLFGISAGLFIVPIHSFIQFKSPGKHRGEILAASGFLGWVGVLLAAGMAYLLSGPLELSAAQGFLIIGCVTFALTFITMKVLPDFFIRFIALMLMKLCYRIKVIGRENIPFEGPALLVPNHVSWIDALLLTATQQRRIRFVMQREIYSKWYLRSLLKLMGVIPISSEDAPRKIVASLKEARSALENGQMVCIFAEGAITRSGMISDFREGMERIAKGAGCPVIPVYLGGVWGSIFSYAHGRLLSRWPVKLPYPVTVLFGKQLPSTCRAEEVKQAVTELSCEYFNSRKGKRKSLGEVLIASARRNWRQHALSDTSGKSLSCGRMLTGVMVLARAIRTQTGDEEKIGILLPPSAGGALVNMALAVLGKVSVNLNYTASVESVRSAIEQCGIKTVITSEKFMEKMDSFRVLKGTVSLEDLIGRVSTLEKAYAWLKARSGPLRALRKSGFKADDPATIIFSSGSTGEPKGVMLSHHNILSNVEAVQMVLRTTSQDNICSALPFFHSLGYTGTLWLPILSGFSVSYHVNPMEGGKIAEVVRRHRSTMLLAAPTFLIAYIRKASAEDFASLRLVITGAEKLKERIADAFQNKFGIRPLEGYGATELSPVIALNLPDVEIHGVHQVGAREGSVGRAIPGVAIRIIDPDTREAVSAGESGLIMVKGPNVMLGYLKRPELTAGVICNGWYETGDIGWLDKEGFLYITDRLARFSKIGGEMIPHKGIEDEFYSRLNQSGQSLAVTSVPDERKGEKLVVLFTGEAGDVERLQQIMTESSLPNLWKPNHDSYIQIDELPLLGSGKLDIKRLRQIAQEEVAIQCV